MIKREKILVIGACGQIGTELTAALRLRYGQGAVLAADRHPASELPVMWQPYIRLDVTDRDALRCIVREAGITQIYHLAALLSANGEQDPQLAWEINMNGLLNVLEVSRLENIGKVFWPSSIAVFGPSSPKVACPQRTVTEPATVYGISKAAGEYWCAYYHRRYGLDVRSLRYPGLISHTAQPGGGTTDYAVAVFHQLLEDGQYTCYLAPETRLPMLYMADAVRATLELMDAPAERLTVRTAYNIQGLSFTPAELAAEIAQALPGSRVDCAPDFRQEIADSWPESLEDSAARTDWGWAPAYSLGDMTREMLGALRLRAHEPLQT